MPIIDFLKSADSIESLLKAYEAVVIRGDAEDVRIARNFVATRFWELEKRLKGALKAAENRKRKETLYNA